MEKCKKCGEWIDWNDPNVHYGGHTCKPKPETSIESEDKKPVKVQFPTNDSIQSIQQLLSWKDVFDARKLFPKNFDETIEFLKATRYVYFAFNGAVYYIDTTGIMDYICLESAVK